MARMQRFHRGRWVRVLGWNIHILREVHDDFGFGKQSSKDRMMAWGHHAWPKKSEETNVLQKWGLHVLGGLGTSLHQLILVKGYWPRWCRMHLSNTTTFRERHSVQTTPFTTEGCNLIARIFEFQTRVNSTCCFEFWKMQHTWGLQHFQISPRRFYMSKIKCGSKMMPGWSTCLIKWSEIIQLPGHHEYISAQVFFFFFFGLRICGA